MTVTATDIDSGKLNVFHSLATLKGKIVGFILTLKIGKETIESANRTTEVRKSMWTLHDGKANQIKLYNENMLCDRASITSQSEHDINGIFFDFYFCCRQINFRRTHTRTGTSVHCICTYSVTMILISTLDQNTHTKSYNKDKWEVKRLKMQRAIFRFRSFFLVAELLFLKLLSCQKSFFFQRFFLCYRTKYKRNKTSDKINVFKRQVINVVFYWSKLQPRPKSKSN